MEKLALEKKGKKRQRQASMLISRDLETLIDACLCLRSVLDMSKLTLYYDLYEVFSFLT
jgi:hypothetical protein